MKQIWKRSLGLSLFFACLMIGAFWANYQFVLRNPGGTDFLVHWVGARALFSGESPYGDTTALEIQQMVYGRPAAPGEHELRVAYPIYSALIFGPFALIPDFALARSLWMTFLEGVILGVTLLSLVVLDWRPHPIIFSFLIGFSLSWYHGIRPLINGNAVAVIALLLVGVVWALRKEWHAMAGVLLALATIKPHLVVIPGLLLLLRAGLTGRWKFIVWFFGSLFALILIGMAIVPNWLSQNLSEIMRYTSYNPPTTPGDALESWLPGFGRQIGWLISVILAIILLWEWVNALRSGFPHLLWVFCLTLVASQWIGITTDPGNFIILTLPLMLVLEFIHELPNGRIWTAATLSVLFIVLWMLFLLTLPPGSQQQSPAMFFPLPFFLLIMLYFCRKKYTRQET